jgi:hypothetical protein
MTKPELKHLDETKRPNRQPIDGPRSIMSIPNQDPNYHYTVQTAEPGNLERFIAAGYEFVTDPVKIGDPTVNKSVRIPEMGTALTFEYRGVTHYALRIRRDWWLEDKAAEERRIREAEDQAAAPSNEGGYGDVKQSLGDKPLHKGHVLGGR